MKMASVEHHHAYIERVVDLLDPDLNVFLNTTSGEAADAVRSGNPDRVRAIEGQFALAAKDGSTVRMARSIGRPMRFFLTKRTEGPCLVISERIDEIHGFLKKESLRGRCMRLAGASGWAALFGSAALVGQVSLFGRAGV